MGNPIPSGSARWEKIRDLFAQTRHMVVESLPNGEFRLLTGKAKYRLDGLPDDAEFLLTENPSGRMAISILHAGGILPPKRILDKHFDLLFAGRDAWHTVLRDILVGMAGIATKTPSEYRAFISAILDQMNPLAPAPFRSDGSNQSGVVMMNLLAPSGKSECKIRISEIVARRENLFEVPLMGGAFQTASCRCGYLTGAAFLRYLPFERIGSSCPDDEKAWLSEQFELLVGHPASFMAISDFFADPAFEDRANLVAHVLGKPDIRAEIEKRAMALAMEGSATTWKDEVAAEIWL